MGRTYKKVGADGKIIQDSATFDMNAAGSEFAGRVLEKLGIAMIMNRVAHDMTGYLNDRCKQIVASSDFQSRLEQAVYEVVADDASLTGMTLEGDVEYCKQFLVEFAASEYGCASDYVQNKQV